MREENFISLIREILTKAMTLKNASTNEDCKIDYVIVFSQNSRQYHEIMEAVKEMGRVVHSTATGDVLKLYKPLRTTAGELFLIKVGKTDALKSQLGAVYFSVENFLEFKKRHGENKNFKIINEPSTLMELHSDDVSIFFSGISLTEKLDL
jgi:hypothetical protein